MALCKLGKTTHQDGGIFYICQVTKNHCDKYTRWCSQTGQYEPKDDCSKCPTLISKLLNDEALKAQNVQEKELKEESKETKKTDNKKSKK